MYQPHHLLHFGRQFALIKLAPQLRTVGGGGGAVEIAKIPIELERNTYTSGRKHSKVHGMYGRCALHFVNLPF
jgi:hypothetical protein